MTFIQSLSKFKVGVRIYAGFTMVIAILAYISYVAIFDFKGFGKSFDTYESITKNTKKAMEIDRNIVGLRRNVFEFWTNGDEKVLNRAKELIVTIDNNFKEIISMMWTEERIKMMEESQANFKVYSDNFAKVIDLRAKRQEAVKNGTDVLGREGSKILSDTFTLGVQSQDLRLLGHIAKAQDDFNMARMAVLRYQGRYDEKEVETVRTKLDSFKKNLEETQFSTLF